jgi:hypothetical protein
MTMSEDAIRPETRALDAYIAATVERLLAREGSEAPAHDSLLFLGNWHDAMPRLIFQDPVLQPVDTRVWGVIKIAATGAGPTAFPSYRHIATTANVASEATVARSMAILRATRWLTLCRRVRDPRGRFRGNVYALHDEPLPLPDTLHLDQAYLRFLEQAVDHAHAQVRKVVAAVLGTIEDDIRTGHCVNDPEHPIERRLRSLRTLQADEAEGRFFSLSSDRLQKLKSEAASHPLQNLKPVRSSSCSSLKETTTTTPTADKGEDAARTGERDEATRSLLIPEALRGNEEALARLYVKHAPVSVRQDILDELAGRLRAAKTKGQPIANPIGYLAQLCKAAAAGRFVLTSLGLQVQQARTQEARLKRVDEVSRERGAARIQELLARRRHDSPGEP